MTCKDCKLWKTCNSASKSDEYGEDGDSWANWCDDFRTIHRSRSVRNGEYIIYQSGYNWHIMMIHEPTGKMMMHCSCTAKKTKKELFDMVKLYHDLQKIEKEILNDERKEAGQAK